TTQSVPRSGPLADLVSAFVEGLDFVLLTAVDSMETKDAAVIEMFFGITSDRGDLVERFRNEFLADTAATSSDRAVLLQVTNIFERIVWMAHRLARLMDTGQAQLKVPIPAIAHPVQGHLRQES